MMHLCIMLYTYWPVAAPITVCHHIFANKSLHGDGKLVELLYKYHIKKCLTMSQVVVRPFIYSWYTKCV